VLERLKLHQLAKGAATAQRTLFTAAVELAAPDVERIVALQPVLERLGIEAERFGATTVAVKALPIESRNPAELITELLGVLPDESAALKVLAHHAAAVPRSASASEAQALLAGLDEVDFDVACLHGKVVVHEVPLFQLVHE
jgi:DNA mismatch repair protein MutL